MSNSENQGPGHNKSTTIIVNARQVVVDDKRLSYEQLVKLAFPADLPDEATVYTVSYANEHGHDGSMAAGQSVEVKVGMVFNVGKTSRS